MLVRPSARQILPVRRLLPSGPLRLPCRRSVADPPRSLAETRRLLVTGNDARPWKRKTFRAAVGFERNLATGLEEHRFGDDVPFEGLPSGLASSYLSGASQSALYQLKPFIASSSPLVIPNPPSRPTAQLRKNGLGIPGDLEEMLSVFEACVQVGRLDRAAMILKRFESTDLVTPHQLMGLHNRYLEARVGQLTVEPTFARAEEVHKWFELRIHAKHLPLAPITIAYMLKTTLLATAESPARKARLERYMNMIRHLSATDFVDLEDVLTVDDLAAIAKACPDFDVPQELFADGQAADGEPGGPGDLTEHGAQTPPSDSRTDIDEVLSTPQKGMGLRSLKATLSLFSELPANVDFATLSPSQRREVQIRLEKDCLDAAVARWREENRTLLNMGLSQQMTAPSLNSRLSVWHREIETRLKKEQAKVIPSEDAKSKSPADQERCTYGPHLLQSPAARLAAVTILTTFGMLGIHGTHQGVPVANLVTNIGKVVEDDIRAQLSTRTPHRAQAKANLKLKSRQQNARHLMRHRSPATTELVSTPASASQAAAASTAAPPVPDHYWAIMQARWPLSVKTKVGAVLLQALIDSARITVYKEHPETKQRISQVQPAFTHTMQLKRGKKVGVIVPNGALVEVLKREPRGEALARHLPMVVEPEPWTKFDKGGLITTPTPLVRLKGNEVDQRIYAQAAIERGDLEQMMRGLDVLGKTAWRINRPVFDVLVEIWNSGEAFANLPPLNPKIDIPTEPDSTDDPIQRRIWLKAVKAAENERAGLHSVRCFMNFQLETARALRDQTFYFPHNLDFRGRAYPIPTYLNHMGADHLRGLLVFAKGRPLGEGGLRWLKVHLANVYGYDKASLKEREDFATENLGNIFESADSPLTGKRWWLGAEDPWQCLATCFELKAALQSPDPAAFISHLPVHQDGTCNGLQHYAALGGDTWGAEQVNLLPGERPADVYSAVALLARQEVGKDVAADHPLAKAVDGKITRKVVKQTVMTNVYGVTFVGAKRQIQKQLDSLYPDLELEKGVSSQVLASYIATKVFRAMSTMFRGAHDIQAWLGEIGGRVCRSVTPEQMRRLAETSGPGIGKVTKSSNLKQEAQLASQFRNTLVWTTPLRMPVVQPYRKSSTRKIETCLQHLTMVDGDRDCPVDRTKQLQAFPPNFIHSLDASHMVLSALECHEIGLTFAAVHDSFWTHAADVDRMNTIIRDSFVRIHSEDVIGRLKAEFEARYRGCLYRARISAGTDAAKKIIAHRKQFPANPLQELLQEKQRQDLLNSTDPEEVRLGREMVTPTSIFESMAAPDMVESALDPEDMLPSARGEDEDGEATAAGAPETDEAGGESEGEMAPDPESLAPPETETEEEAAERREREQTFLSEICGENYFVVELKNGFRKEWKDWRARKAEVALWLPLTFPDIPKKGGLDVQKLRDSKYFFS